MMLFNQEKSWNYYDFMPNVVDERQRKWDNRFLMLAKEVSTWSKDPSTKVGAVGVDNGNNIISTGYNGFPRGIADDDRLMDRATKYELIIHAEANCLLRATGYIDTLYCWPLPPCSRCAALIINKGISQVVAPSTWSERWNESIEMSLALFRESAVEYRLYDNYNMVIL